MICFGEQRNITPQAIVPDIKCVCLRPRNEPPSLIRFSPRTGEPHQGRLVGRTGLIEGGRWAMRAPSMGLMSRVGLIKADQCARRALSKTPMSQTGLTGETNAPDLSYQGRPMGLIKGGRCAERASSRKTNGSGGPHQGTSVGRRAPPRETDESGESH